MGTLDNCVKAVKKSFYIKRKKTDPIVYSVPVALNVADSVQTAIYLNNNWGTEEGHFTQLMIDEFGVNAGLIIKGGLEALILAVSYLGANFLEQYKNEKDHKWEIVGRKILSPIARYGTPMYKAASHSIGILSPYIDMPSLNDFFNTVYEFGKLFVP